MLDFLYMAGDLADRRAQHRSSSVLYDLPERVLPPRCSPRPTPDRRGGVASSWSAGRRSRTASATAQCLRDYFRMHNELA